MTTSLSRTRRTDTPSMPRTRPAVGVRKTSVAPSSSTRKTADPASADRTKEESDEGGEIPEYAGELAAYHEAFTPELRAAIGELACLHGTRILDVPCGDGYYTCWLAEQGGPGTQVTGADLLPAYIKEAEKRARRLRLDKAIRFVTTDAYHMDLPADHFDTVFCAQSFISLEDPLQALKEMYRVLKPGGHLVVLEDDEFHHLVLPWPAKLEVALQAALVQTCEERWGQAGKLYVSRRIRRLLRSVKFQKIQRTTHTADRAAPLSATSRRYLALYLKRLASLVGKRLQGVHRRTFERATSPASPQYLLDSPDLELTCMFAVWTAQKSAPSGIPS